MHSAVLIKSVKQLTKITVPRNHILEPHILVVNCISIAVYNYLFDYCDGIFLMVKVHVF